MDDTMALRIHQKRIEKGLTLEELGAKLGVQPAAVNKWEKGRVTNIKRSTIQKMAEVFDCSPIWLMGLSNELNHELNHANYVAEVLQKKEGSICVAPIEEIEQSLITMDNKSLERVKAFAEYLIAKNKTEVKQK